MDVLEYKYFVVTGGKALEIIEAAKVKHKEWINDCQSIAEEFGIESLRARRYWVCSLELSETQKQTLKFVRRDKSGEWVPRKNTDIGKLLSRRISDLNKKYDRLDNTAEGMFEGETWMFEGRIMRRPSYGKINGLYVVLLPKASKAVPCDGLEEIKTSEYVRMVEEEAEKEKAGEGGAE